MIAHLEVSGDYVKLLAAVCRGGGMVYATDSKSVSRKGLRVRVPPAAPQERHHFVHFELTASQNRSTYREVRLAIFAPDASKLA